jgi:hypothetical protein
MPLHKIIYEVTMAELDCLLHEAVPHLNQEQIAIVNEVIDSYCYSLLKFRCPISFIEFCKRAVVDVTHEIASLRYGSESPEAEAVFDVEDRRLSHFIRCLNKLRPKHRPAAKAP